MLEITIPLVSQNIQHLLLGHEGINQTSDEGPWDLTTAVNVSMLKFQSNQV